MGELEVVPLPEVARIVHEGSSWIEPPLDQTWSEDERLAWHAAVVAVDTGLRVKVWTGAADPRSPFVIGLGTAAAGMGSSGDFDFHAASTFLSGIRVGVERMLAQAAAQAREVEGVLYEHVLTWHPIGAPDDAPGAEIPLYEHITLPEGIGELRSHTREMGGADQAEIEEDPAATLTVDFLGLVDVSVNVEQAAGWTRAQRKQAVQWAAATHLSASDNDDVEVPPRPAFLPGVSGA